jgi:hypothetical protein
VNATMLKRAAFNELEIIPRPASAALCDLLGYWQQKCAGRAMPRRADIDPVEIPSHLGDVFMLDVLQDGADFRYRLIGTRIVHGMGRDATGRTVSELYRRQPDVAAKLCALFSRPVIEKRPIFARGRIFWNPARDVRHFEAAYLPLAEDGEKVNIVLCELFVMWPNARKRG